MSVPVSLLPGKICLSMVIQVILSQAYAYLKMQTLSQEEPSVSPVLNSVPLRI